MLGVFCYNADILFTGEWGMCKSDTILVLLTGYVYVVSMIPRWTFSLCGSHKRWAQNSLGYFFQPEIHIELINFPCPQLTSPGVEYIVCVEVRRCIVLNADAMIHNLPEVMTTRISQKLSLVTSALIRSGNKGDNPLTCSSVVGFQKIGSYIDLPLIPKCVH
jgi:hypothetical protein